MITSEPVLTSHMIQHNQQRSLFKASGDSWLLVSKDNLNKQLAHHYHTTLFTDNTSTYNNHWHSHSSMLQTVFNCGPPIMAQM